MAVMTRIRVDPKQFGARLKMLREAAELSQAELARRSGVKTQSLASWEIGHRTPNFIDVIRIAAALGKNVDDFTVIPAEIPDPKLGRPARPKSEAN